MPAPALALLLLQSPAPPLEPAQAGPATVVRPPLEPVPFEKVRLADAFFAPRIETNRRVTIPACLAKCEETGRIGNFAVAAGLAEGQHRGLLFDDSDLYKVLEGIAYSLRSARDPKLEARADAIIDLVAAAQRKDGYLDTYWQLVRPDARWSDIRHGHELYCAGHLIEAAIAYEAATGKKKLLDVALKLAAHVDSVFGWGKRQEPTGHPELELALMKLHRRTGEKRWLELARFLVDVRGRKDRGTALFGEYAQDHLPVREQPEPVGHAVRAMYLYGGMADVAAATGDATLLAPLERLWEDLLERKTYVTGGIGSTGSNEGFGAPYDLPNDTAYCETCAAIGMALWNHRMFLLTRRTRYADVLEREVYNNVPAGVSLSGDRFFYDNPLASRGQHARVPWFDCSCCPTNLARFLPAMGERLWAVEGQDLHAILYAASTADVEVAGVKVRITEDTDHPRSGSVRLAFAPERPVRFALHLRVPGWGTGATAIAPREPPGPVDPARFPQRRRSEGSDEFVLDREWRAGDVARLELPMEPRRIRADPKVDADAGRAALAFGPLVYCLEGIDHDGRARSRVLPPAAQLKAGWDGALLGGTNVLRARGEALAGDDPFHRLSHPADLVAVPYCLWANRGKGEMVVWIPESADLAEVPGSGVQAEQGGALLRASHCWRSDTLLALNDGKLPASPGDESIPRLTFWDHKGTSEWVEMRFREPRRVASSRVDWFDDTGRGSCRPPESWRLLRLVDREWRPAEVGPDGALAAPGETTGLRLEIALRKDFSAGILEWRVE